MKRKVLIAITIVLLMTGCENYTTQEKPEPEINNQVFITDSYEAIKNGQINVRWANGTLFIIRDESIINEFLSIISNVEYEHDPEDKSGYLYFVIYDNITLTNTGRFNDSYKLKDTAVNDKIDNLLTDYLPLYNYGSLEFQSDIMPDSHLYIVVKIEKNEDGKLYFTQHHNDYGFISGTTDINTAFKAGDIVEIETDGRLPEGDLIHIKSYCITKSE